MGEGLVQGEGFAGLLRGAVVSMHQASAVAPIRFPGLEGGFPGDILLRPPPVVVDANVLRNDILRACRTGRRTVLVSAANAGCIRLFCARHVYDEVVEHSGDWTAAGPVTRNAFLRAWLLEYLPLIRVVTVVDEHQGWLSPAERVRVSHLAEPGQDRDDVPSAVLALLLGAFFLSEDRKPLRAVYGDADLTGHRDWVDKLKAGGDAGQLGKALTLTANLTVLAGQGLSAGARKVTAAAGPWALAAAGLGAAWWYLSRPADTRRQFTSAAVTVLVCAAEAAVTYQQVRDRFASYAPQAPGWQSLAADLPAAAVLGRGCLHTLARALGNDLSAAELTRELPCLAVAQGEAKVRQALRGGGPFTEVWRGRWQAGHPGPALQRYLVVRAAGASEPAAIR